MLQAMNAGSVDIGGVGNTPPVFAAAGGSKIEIVGAYQANPWGRRSGAEGLADHVRGGPEGQADRGGPGQLGQLPPARPAEQGGPERARRDPDLPAAGRRAGRAQLGARRRVGDLDPFTAQAEVQKSQGAGHRDRATAAPYSFQVASRAALDDPARAAAIKDYLALVAQAHVWATNHQSAWAKVWAKETGLPDTVMVQGGQRRRRSRRADHTSGHRLRAAGGRRVHQGRADPGARVDVGDYVGHLRSTTRPRTARGLS